VAKRFAFWSTAMTRFFHTAAFLFMTAVVVGGAIASVILR
jgi:hypothetical protein